MKYLSDYHMHSKYSFDAVQTIEQAIKKAISMNTSEVCLTEHISFDPDDKSYNFFNFSDYEREINELSHKYQDAIKVKIGLEAGEIHLYNNEFNKFFRENNLDFIIGSIHNINRLGLNTNLREFGSSTTYKNYFNEVLTLASNSDFDVLGHLDLVQRYAFKTYGVYEFNTYKDIIHEILKTLITNGKGIEVNTSGLKENLLFPKLEILQMYKDLKGEIITVGSDSHNYNRVGENIENTYNLLKDIGFKYVFTFEKRQPKGISL